MYSYSLYIQHGLNKEILFKRLLKASSVPLNLLLTQMAVDSSALRMSVVKKRIISRNESALIAATQVRNMSTLNSGRTFIYGVHTAQSILRPERVFVVVPEDAA